MTTSADEKALLELTQQLLDSIASGDWDTYEQLCDPTLTAFEPEARGHLVEGMEFHHFYLSRTGERSAISNTIATPHVRLVGTDAAVVSCVRLVQLMDDSGGFQTHAFEETRVWERQEGTWKHVHFHRSSNS